MLVHKLKTILKSEYYRNVFTLFSGTALGQVIPLAILPLLTRLYSGNEMGTYFLFASIVSIFSVLSTLRYPLAIVLPAKFEDAINMWAFCVLIAFGVCMLGYGILLVGHKWILQFVPGGHSTGWIFLVPLAMLFVGLIETSNHLFNRLKQYKQISITTITRSSTASFTQWVLFYLLPAQGQGLIWGYIAGLFVSMLYGVTRTFRQLGQEIIKHTKWSEMRRVAIEYKQIPVFNTLLSFSNSLSNHLPILLLTPFFGIQITAYYGLAHRAIATPVGFFVQSFGQVFFQEATGIYQRKEDLHRYLKSTYRRLFKLSVIPFILFVIFAPILFSWVFGSDWSTAGVYTRYLSPWLLIIFINSPVSQLITILGKQKFFFFLDLLVLIARFFAIYAGYSYFNNPAISISLYALIGVIYNLYVVYHFLSLTRELHAHSPKIP